MQLNFYSFSKNFRFSLLGGALFIGLICVVTFSFWFFKNAPAFAQEQALGDESIASEPCSDYDQNRKCLTDEIFEAAGVYEDADPSDFKHLYLEVFKNVRQSPSDQALKDVAARYQYTETEMRAILSGSLGSLLLTQDGTVTNEDAFQLLDNIRSDYDEAYADAQRKEEMMMDAYPKEIFANGNTGDSGFDLLYDLEIIEKLLFEHSGEESSPTTGGSGVATEDDEEEEDENAATTTEEDQEESEEGEETDAGELGEASGSENEQASGQSSSKNSSSGSPSESEETEACVDDPELQSAFTDAVALNESDPQNADGTPSSAATDSTADRDAQTSSNSGDTSESGSEDDSDASNSDVPSSVSPAEPKDWKSKLPCNSRFCLVIRFVNEKLQPTYQDTSTCIQCHVEGILNALKTTTSTGLTPGKLTGNLFEPSLCKKALYDTKVSLNFFPVAVPIQTPPGDDLIIGRTLCEELNDFGEDSGMVKDGKEGFYGMMFDSTCKGDPAELSEEEKEDLRRFYQLGIREKLLYQQSISPPNSSSQDIFEAATKAHEDELKAVQRHFRNSRTQARMASSTTDFYKASSYEMDQMNAYFESYKGLIGVTQQVASEMEKNLKRVSWNVIPQVFAQEDDSSLQQTAADVKQTASACLNQFGEFLTSLLSFGSAQDYWEDIFRRNACQQTDIFSLDDQVEAKMKRLREEYYEHCSSEDISALQGEIREKKMEIHFVRHIVPVNEDSSSDNDLKAFQKQFPAIQTNLKQEMTDEYVSAKRWVSEDQFNALFDEWLIRYQERIAVYLECSGSPWQEVAEKWQEFHEKIKAFIDLLKEIQSKLKGSEDKDEKEDKAEDEKPTGEKNSPLSAIAGFLDKHIDFRMNNLTPPKALENFIEDAQQKGEAVTVQEAFELINLEEQHHQTAVTAAELLGRYTLLYRQGSGEVAKDLKTKLEALADILKTTATDAEYLPGLHRAAKAIHKKQGGGKP